MPTRIIGSKLNKQFELMRDLLQRCVSFAEKCSDAEASKVIYDRLASLQSAALFVIVGEVKSGKSSFVNALLQEDVCDVAPDPCTAVIQELVYGEERAKTVLGENWERVSLPKDVLKEITIVDTPGTNSIIRNHQVITENYIPQSDIVVFVFPAKNPHTATAWDLLSLIRRDWYRKVVFVLQQSDIATQRELSINRDKVEQYARERNVQNPTVFMVSAKRELEGSADSGYSEFREYLRKAVETGEVWKMKVDGARDTARKIISNLLARLKSEQAEIADDRAFYETLIAKVESRREKSTSLRRLAVDSLCVSYDRLASKLENDFSDGLEVGTVLRRSIPFVRDKDVKQWLNELKSNFMDAANKEINSESLRVSKDISDELMSMFNELRESVSNRQNIKGDTLSSKDSDRIEILSRLKKALEDLRIEDIVGDKAIQGTDIGNLTLVGGGIAALGAVIALTTQLAVLDITGGILAAIGAGLIVVTLLWKRTSIVKDFKNRIGLSRKEFRDRLDQEIAKIFEKLFVEVEHRLKEPITSLNVKNSRLELLSKEAEELMQMTETIFQ